jgi:hypothetical protein
MDFDKGWQWFPIAGHCVAVVTGVLAGLASLPAAACVALKSLETAVVACFFVLLVAARPHSVRSDLWLAVGSTSLQLATAGLSLAGRDVSVTCLALQIVIVTVHLVGYIAWSSLSGAARFLWLVGRLRRHRRRRQRRSAPQFTDLEALRLREIFDSQRNSFSRMQQADEILLNQDVWAALQILVEAVCRTSANQQL